MVNEITFKVVEAIIEGKDLVLTLDLGCVDPVDCVINDFVPDDYNSGEKIVGGYETPDFVEFQDEYMTTTDWWNEFSRKEQNAMISEELTKKLQQ